MPSAWMERIDGFPIDLQQYYRVIAAWKEDASLAGSETFLKAADKSLKKMRTPILAKVDPGDHWAILVIPDSCGRICNLTLFLDRFLADAISWPNAPKSTPQDYLDLKEKQIGYIVAGEDHLI